MSSITFKEYLASKQQLLQAANESPVRIGTYVVNKYCKLRVGDDKDLKEYITFKPKQSLLVEWKYHDGELESPEPTTIVVELTSESFLPFQSSARLMKWLDVNTTELPPI